MDMGMDLPKEIWDKICGGVGYDEHTHGPLILQTFFAGGTLSDFCLEIGASRQRVARWQMDHPEFQEAALLAKEMGTQQWLREARENFSNTDFSSKLWESVGRKLYGSLDKISVQVDSDKSPIEQYQQIMKQAASGAYSSSELKQLMEAVNIGLRAHEVCELQLELEEIKEGLKKMEERELEHQISDNPATEEDKVTVDSENGDTGDTKE